MKKIRLIKESLYESNGAGFSMSSRTRGGFGGGGNIGGTNTMYTYEIKPLNHILEPITQSIPKPIASITIGSKIIGSAIMSNARPDRNNKIKGIVIDIVYTNNNVLKYYIVQDKATQKHVKIEPLSAELEINNPVMNYTTYQSDISSRRKEKIKNKQVVKEQLYQ